MDIRDFLGSGGSRIRDIGQTGVDGQVEGIVDEIVDGLVVGSGGRRCSFRNGMLGGFNAGVDFARRGITAKSPV